MPTRRLALRCSPALLGLLAGTSARAQDWQPDRPVRLVINTTPGGAVDAVGRIVAARLAERLGRPVVPENRAGASGTVAGAAVMAAPADGHVLLFGASIHALARAVVRNPPYDPLADFTPVARVAEGPLLVIAAPTVAGNLGEVAAAVRAAPSRFAFATSSLGSAGHLATLAFLKHVGVDLPVASYRGSAPALADLAGGTVQLMVDPILSALPLVRGGQIRGLAVTAAARSPVAPEVPTAAEAGLPGLEFASWYALWGPRSLPAPVITRLNGILREEMAAPEVVARLTALGFSPVAESPAAFAAFQAAEAELGGRLLREAGFQPD